MKIKITLSKFAAWILAQVLGRLNWVTRSGKVNHLCFCYSPIHVLINIADPSVTREGVCFFPGICAKGLSGTVEALGFKSEKLSTALFIHALISSVCRGRRFMVWLPHLGPDDLPPFVRRLILELEPLQTVRFIDDGFSFLSRDTLIYQKNYISPDVTIYSWDFTVPLVELGMPPTVSRSYFRHAINIVKSSCPLLVNKGLGQISCQIRQEINVPVSLVLASKLLDVDFCLASLISGSSYSNAFYIPHYNFNKNYGQMQLALTSLPLEVPELGLLGIALSMPCRIFFGLTSSIIILIELLLRFEVAHTIDFIYAVNETLVNSSSIQVDSFRKVLAYYQRLDAVRSRFINIVFE